MPEETAEKLKEVAQKATEEKTVASIPDVCKTPSPTGPVPVPYPNTAKTSDTSSGSKTVKIEGKKAMTKKSLFKKSTGDEPGSSSWKSINNIMKRATSSKVLNIPLWIWGVGVVVLLLAVWILATNNPQPTEPIEQYIVELIALVT